MTPHNAAVIVLVVMFLIGTPYVTPGTKWIRDIPTDRTTWVVCCDHEDCTQVDRVGVEWLSEEMSKVTVDSYPPFIMKSENIHNSQNGKKYLCRNYVDKPPSERNTRCVFTTEGFS